MVGTLQTFINATSLAYVSGKKIKHALIQVHGAHKILEFVAPTGYVIQVTTAPTGRKHEEEILRVMLLMLEFVPNC